MTSGRRSVDIASGEIAQNRQCFSHVRHGQAAQVYAK